jgi:hypothetical protein
MAQTGERLGVRRALLVEWSVWSPSLVSEQDLRRAKDAVRAHSQHPARAQIGRMEWEVRHGINSERTLIMADGRWRTRQVWTGPGGDAVDSGMAGGDAWVWNADAVTVVKAENPPPGKDYASMRGDFMWDAMLLLSGGLSDVPPSKRTWSVVSMDGAGWKATATQPSGEKTRELEAVGSWEAAAEKWVDVSRLTVKEGGAVVASFGFEGWSTHADSVRAATNVVVHDGSGNVAQRLKLKRIAYLDMADAIATTKIPRQGEADLLRGMVQRLSVLDERRTTRELTYTTPEGMVELPMPDTADSRRAATLRRFGWVLGAGVAVILAGLAWKRARAIGM